MTSDYKAKVLIVEDEVDSLTLLSSALGRIFPKSTLYTAADGLGGLDKFKEFEPDIVLTDLNLPGMDGVQLVAEMRALRPGTRIIVITAESNRKEVEALSGRELAADHFLVKPVDLRELQNLIAC